MESYSFPSKLEIPILLFSINSLTRFLSCFLEQNYFRDPWNFFDCIIVLGSFIDIAYGKISVSYSPFFSLFLSFPIQGTRNAVHESETNSVLTL